MANKEEKKISFLPKEEKERIEKEIKKLKKKKEETVKYVTPKKEEEKDIIFSGERRHFLFSDLFSKLMVFLKKLKPSKAVKVKEEKVILEKVKAKPKVWVYEEEEQEKKRKQEEKKAKEKKEEVEKKEKEKKEEKIEKEKEQENKMTTPLKEKISEETLEVSLIPEEVIESPVAQKKILMIILWGIVSLLVIGGLFIVLKIEERELDKNILSMEQNIKALDQELNRLTEVYSRVNILKTKIKRSQDLLDRHIYWTNFFSKLEKYTLPEVSYAGLNANTEKEISLKTTAIDYRTAARQLLVLQSARDFIKEVNVSGLKFTEKEGRSRVNFNLNLTLVENLFQYHPTR